MSILSQSGVIPGELMVASVVFLFILFLIVLFLYLRVRHRRVPNVRLDNSPTLLPFSSSSSGAVPLDASVLKSLPSTVFRSASDMKAGYGSECAVCLSELVNGDLSRLLPLCRHAFHLKCIDTWFLSNSTCPICRSSVEPPPTASLSESSMLSEEVKASTLARLRSRGENPDYSSGGWDVDMEPGMGTVEGSSNRLQITQQIAAARDVCERG